ncbi:hypothetical protein [Nonomuraea basaltis]|uniref:hypothetical protein n=1 Tax=Nonomuraea basaltis TaxID=2495887 RepID=UPI00110C622E|nr:hypothetical protein [Nonomuraea basaltis]TMS00135.1 hypothetical protein EJK15_03425 [Nonomuraea basaltis]
MSADLDELVDQMLGPATRLVCAVQDFDPEESHAILEPLDAVELRSLAVALAALVPDDMALEVLLAWSRNEGPISPRKARVNRRRLESEVAEHEQRKRSAA